MYRALVIKELRECLPLLAVATLLAAGFLHAYTAEPLWLGVRRGASQIPFVQGDFHYGPLLAIAGGFAVLLGIQQAVFDELRGTFHYVLARPVERSQLFLIKAGVGIVLVQLVGAAMIVVYGLWAATPGTHPSPFFWSMTVPAWQVWVVSPNVYLTALLCGLRPARWYGSRLLPLVGCGFIAFVLVIQPWLWISVVGSVLMGAALAPCILFVARTRDY